MLAYEAGLNNTYDAIAANVALRRGDMATVARIMGSNGSLAFSDDEGVAPFQPVFAINGLSDAFKEHHLKHRDLLQKFLGKRYGEWATDQGAQFLEDLANLIHRQHLQV